MLLSYDGYSRDIHYSMGEKQQKTYKQDSAGKDDVFAEIAAQEMVYRDTSLIEPQPAALENTQLPLEEASRNGVFQPLERINSPEGLNRELEHMRAKFLPFMARLSPPIESRRVREYLETFDWRMETDADCIDFHSVCQGGGEWKPVAVPHYGGPLGKAVGYYRTTFEVTQTQLDIGAAFLCFKGVDYKAQVFVNGSYVGSHEGFFAPFEFDVSAWVRLGQNHLVVRVENDAVFNGNHAWGQPYAGDKIYAATGPGYDDPACGWHHCPPGMGIYQKVFLEYRPVVHLSDIFVRPLPEEKRAEVWLEIHNTAMNDAAMRVCVSIYGRNFRQCVVEGFDYAPEAIHDCGLGDAYQIAKAKAEGKYRKKVPLAMERGLNYLRISVPMESCRLWSPDAPWLYQCQVTLKDASGAPVDCSEKHFGMRSFEQVEREGLKGALLLNGNPVRLRGANTMGHEQQCVIREDWEQLRDDILLAKTANMNFLRLTQRPVQDEVYDYCDMLGLMTQTDLPLFGVIRRNKYCEVLRQVEEMERLVRSHPCNIMVTYINEPTRNADNRPHRHIRRDEMEHLFSAASDIVRHLNPERVIKPCDGDYDPPAPGIQDRHCYPCWYNGHGMDVGKLHRGYWQPTKPDWYYACGEYGAEGLDFPALMKKRYPAEWLEGVEDDNGGWSPSQIVRAQTANYHYFFYDTQETLEDWVQASQAHQSFGTKIMTEAFRRDSRMVSFAIHLFIDAFPAGWMKAIMDCERKPKPAYFAYRDALAPLLPNLRTDRTCFTAGESIRIEAWICNDLPEADRPLFLSYYIESEGGTLASGKIAAHYQACHSDFQGYLTFTAPEVAERSHLRCRLALMDAEGAVLNDCELSLEVFPSQVATQALSVAVPGPREGKAARLADELGVGELIGEDRLHAAETILIDDYAQYAEKRDTIDAAVAQGARVLFLGLAPGKYTVGDTDVAIKASGFNPMYFASRKTGSAYVEGLNHQDIGYWYDPPLDRMAPLLETTFTAPGFEAILTSGNTTDGVWGPALAAAEKPCGKGSFIICQIDLAGRTTTNPAARLLALRLTGLLPVSPVPAGVVETERVSC